MRLYKVVRDAARGFIDDGGVTLGAALAFFTALSLAPLVIMLLWGASVLGPEAQSRLVGQLVEVTGPQSGEAIGMIVRNASERPGLRTAAGLIAVGTLLFAASGVFVQLQKALNTVWNVEKSRGAGVRGFLRKRLMSLAAVIGVAVFLMASLVAGAVLAAATGPLEGALRGGELAWKALDHGVWIVIFTLLFATMFRFLPDVNLRWKDVWFGAIATALLFALGRYAIGLYLGRSAVGSAYCAAGSLIALLVWVFYSAMIMLFGAELTRAWVRHRPRRRGAP